MLFFNMLEMRPRYSCEYCEIQIASTRYVSCRYQQDDGVDGERSQ